MSSNLGWLFYKDYFKDIDYAELESKDSNNEERVKKKIEDLIKASNTVAIEESESLGNIQFQAKTTYPGLILGSGNAHELPNIDGQAILGFSFDYTSGLPVIAGSSIKGVLRSAFKHVEYIEEILEVLGKENVDVTNLEKEIFDNKDVFFDATIQKKATAILGDDFITPHGEDALKNPIPLRFIKVMPGVTFRFDFELSDSSIDADTKSLLFGQILYDLGVGAKTNVGYGKFDDSITIEKLKRQQEQIKEVQQKKREEKEREEKEREEKEQLASLPPKEALIMQINKAESNKEIHDLLNDADENIVNEVKDEILKVLDPKPKDTDANKKKAKTKWLIKVYELLGH